MGEERERGREELKGRRPNATGSWIRSEARNYSNWLVYEIFMFRKFLFTHKSIYLLLSILSFDFFLAVIFLNLYSYSYSYRYIFWSYMINKHSKTCFWYATWTTRFFFFFFLPDLNNYKQNGGGTCELHVTLRKRKWRWQSNEVSDKMFIKEI